MHVIVGAGPVGSRTAELLAKRGERVRIITRSASGPERPGIERIGADASEPAALIPLVEGASVLYNCANPPYTRWLTDWEPLAASVLRAAERTGAVLATASNLYGYGPVSGVIDERTPQDATHPKLRIRAKLWEEALAAHQAGRVRVTEVRASDYLGYQCNSVLADMVLAKTVRGKAGQLFGDVDSRHSWTSCDDVASTLVTVAGDDRAWGRAWLVPTAPAASAREVAKRASVLVGAPPAKVRAIGYRALWTMGLFVPIVKELRATYYQFASDFVMDSSHTEHTFGLTATPLDETIEQTARALLAARP